MTKPLRHVHLRIWIVLPILLVVIMAASLVVRRTTVPVNPTMHWSSLP